MRGIWLSFNARMHDSSKRFDCCEEHGRSVTPSGYRKAAFTGSKYSWHVAGEPSSLRLVYAYIQFGCYPKHPPSRPCASTYAAYLEPWQAKILHPPKPLHPARPQLSVKNS